MEMPSAIGEGGEQFGLMPQAAPARGGEAQGDGQRDEDRDQPEIAGGEECRSGGDGGSRCVGMPQDDDTRAQRRQDSQKRDRKYPGERGVVVFLFHVRL
jgi:hypothetical protein